jgi:hypothetical protein
MEPDSAMWSPEVYAKLSPLSEACLCAGDLVSKLEAACQTIQLTETEMKTWQSRQKGLQRLEAERVAFKVTFDPAEVEYSRVAGELVALSALMATPSFHGLAGSKGEATERRVGRN